MFIICFFNNNIITIHIFKEISKQNANRTTSIHVFIQVLRLRNDKIFLYFLNHSSKSTDNITQ